MCTQELLSSRRGRHRTVPPTGEALRGPVQALYAPGVAMVGTPTGWRETTNFENQPESLYMDISDKARAVQVRDPQFAQFGLA